MNSDIPPMPSLPTIAISAEAPFSNTYNIDTMEVVGKYTWLSVVPDSYNTCPSGIPTHSRYGNQRCQSGSGNAASSWFFLGSWATVGTENRAMADSAEVGAAGILPSPFCKEDLLP